jgi:transcriptional regulator with XRE-family HTH domain
MKPRFHVGDVIERARDQRHWNQEQLGKEAARFPLKGNAGPINKSTVSKIENDPFSSELGTIWRLLAALDLTFSDVERAVGAPFEEESPPSEARTVAGTTAAASGSRRGRSRRSS